MIVISLLAIIGVILVLAQAISSDTASTEMPGLGDVARGMIFLGGIATIFANLFFITLGAILNACVETARNTRAMRLLAGYSAERVPT
jgi:hypothetical protein